MRATTSAEPITLSRRDMDGAMPVPARPGGGRIAGVAPPRITINGRFLTQKPVGVQRFASETTRAMDRLLGQPDYAMLRGRIEIVAPRGARDLGLTHIPMRECGFMQGHAWEQLEFPVWARRSLLLNLCLVGPLAARHRAIVAHDATVRALPNNFSWKFRTAYDFLVPRLLRSDLVCTVSDFSRREIGKYYGVDIDRIPVCYEGCDHITTFAPDTAILDRVGARGRPYFLGVGVDSRNKNIELLLEAFAKAKRPDTLLVLVGLRDVRLHSYSLATSDPNVRPAGYVSDSELRALYEGALALVYPSRYEGFGLPPVEAMQCGCPVVISEQATLCEIAGDAALRCGMDDPESLATILTALQDDPDLRAHMAEAGRARAGHFTWAATARILLDHCVATAAARAL